jgi:hypothetical protein
MIDGRANRFGKAAIVEGRRYGSVIPSELEDEIVETFG